MRLLHPDFPDERPATVDQALALLAKRRRILGDEMAICSPFHYEYHPSFSINVSSGMWICFKGCGQGNLARAWRKRYWMCRTRFARRWVSGVNYGVDGPGVPDVDEPGWYEEDWYAERFAVPPQQKLDERRITAEVAAGPQHPLGLG